MRTQNWTLPLLFRCAIVTLSALGSGLASAQEAPLTACDVYAASDIDSGRKSDPVPDDGIDARLAVPACEADVAQYPSSARLIYQLGRSLMAAGQPEQGVAQYQKAAEMGHAAAQLVLGYAFAG